MAELTYQDARFVWQGTFEERLLPKEAGFRWSPEQRCWWTSFVTTAARLAKFARGEAADLINQHHKSLESSRATDVGIEIPAPEGLSYLPFQRAGVAYVLAAMDRGQPGALIADEMGLGKTIQAIGVINARPEIKRVLVVCPASLKLNWRNELSRWLARPMSVEVWTGKTGSTAADVAVANYDIIKKRLPDLVARGAWDLIILDESQAVKNQKAQRTKAVLSIPTRFSLFLTGTPILNRPIELYTTVARLDPTGMGRSFPGFGIRYAGGFQGRYGWDFSGATHLDELQEKLRSKIMVRRLKQDVLKELPAKRRAVVALEPEGRAVKDALKAQRAAWDALVADLGYEEAVARLQSGGGFDFETISRDRATLAGLKAPLVVDFVREALESSDKVVVFGHHHEMIDALVAGLAEFGVATIDGRTPADLRQAQVEKFQNSADCRVFIGGIHAAGVGLTLTAASHVILAELPWRPADVQQAEDRCHRIGQTDSVFVQHLVFDGSLDADMAHLIVAKQNIADSALDTDHSAAQATAVAETEAMIEAAKAEAQAKLENYRETVASISDEEIRAVHQALRILAGDDLDRAAVKNDVGFNRLDGEFGHKLAHTVRLTPMQAIAARKMLAKYHRQIPAPVFEAMWGRVAA